MKKLITLLVLLTIAFSGFSQTMEVVKVKPGAYVGKKPQFIGEDDSYYYFALPYSYIVKYHKNMVNSEVLKNEDVVGFTADRAKLIQNGNICLAYYRKSRELVVGSSIITPKYRTEFFTKFKVLNNDGTLKKEVDLDKNETIKIAFSNNGKYFVRLCSDSIESDSITEATIEVYESETLNKLASYPLDEDAYYSPMVYVSNTGKASIVNNDFTKMILFDSSGQSSLILSDDKNIEHIDWLIKPLNRKDGKYVISVTYSDSLQLSNMLENDKNESFTDYLKVFIVDFENNRIIRTYKHDLTWSFDDNVRKVTLGKEMWGGLYLYDAKVDKDNNVYLVFSEIRDLNQLALFVGLDFKTVHLLKLSGNSTTTKIYTLGRKDLGSQSHHATSPSLILSENGIQLIYRYMGMNNYRIKCISFDVDLNKNGSISSLIKTKNVYPNFHQPLMINKDSMLFYAIRPNHQRHFYFVRFKP